jgi:small subunit ribosomal protein S17
MKAEKLRELDTSELTKQEGDIREQAFRLRFQLSMGQADGVKKLRVIRKDRARILSILRERELAGQPAAVKAPVKAKKGKKAMGETTPNTIGNKNEKVGEVVSAKMQKTIVVEVTRRVSHPVYKRIIKKRKKFYAHDETGSAKIGDVVRIVECRPMSKLKRWRLDEVVRRAVQVAVEPAALDLPEDALRAKKKKEK